VHDCRGPKGKYEEERTASDVTLIDSVSSDRQRNVLTGNPDLYELRVVTVEMADNTSQNPHLTINGVDVVDIMR
jgi:hypothetical protein